MRSQSAKSSDGRPVLLVLASTYPRWLDDPEPGFVHELAKRLTSRFRVTILGPHAPGAKQRETLDGVEVIRYRYAPERLETLVNAGGIATNLRRSKWKFLLLPSFVAMQAWWAWRLIRTRHVEVVHAHWLIPQGLIAALLRLLSRGKVPFVVTSHGADLFALQGRWLQSVKRFVLRRAASTTVVSGWMRNHVERIGADMKETLVMPMGVDLRCRFSPDDQVRRSGREILFVGRLVEKKVLRHLIDAMPEVLRTIPDAHLTVAGFGPEEQSLKRQVATLGLEGSVSFLGAVPQAALPTLYRRAALFVAPFVRARSGDEEGLGLVVVEAIGCDCPVVVGDVPAVHEVLGDGFSHLAVNPLNTHVLAQRIEKIINAPEYANECAKKLRKAVVRKFSWEQVAAGYSRLLLDSISAERSPL